VANFYRNWLLCSNQLFRLYLSSAPGYGLPRCSGTGKVWFLAMPRPRAAGRCWGVASARPTSTQVFGPRFRGSAAFGRGSCFPPGATSITRPVTLTNNATPRNKIVTPANRLTIIRFLRHFPPMAGAGSFRLCRKAPGGPRARSRRRNPPAGCPAGAPAGPSLLRGRPALQPWWRCAGRVPGATPRRNGPAVVAGGRSGRQLLDQGAGDLGDRGL
jgi:hypothetical protein